MNKDNFSEEQLDEIWQSIKNNLIVEYNLDEIDLDDDSTEDSINRETDDILEELSDRNLLGKIETPWGEGYICNIYGSDSSKAVKVNVNNNIHIMNLGEL